MEKYIPVSAAVEALNACVIMGLPLWNAAIEDAQETLAMVPPANVRPVVRGHWIESKKHLWERDEGGNVDLFRWERDYHNGPVCMKCRRCPCVNCRPDYDDEECYKAHFICSVCGRAELKKEPFCNCGADMREREDNNG